MKNKEIEIKLKLSKNQYDNLEKFLRQKAKFQLETNQKEKYYSPPHKNIIQEDGTIWEWFRLRTEGDIHTVTYKNVHKGDDGKGRQKDEYEFTVSNSEQFDNLIQALDFKELISFSKQRTVFNYKQNYEISLDYIPELGCFTEIELKHINSNIKTAINELEDTILELGLDIAQESILGYPHLMLIHKGLAPLPDFAKNNIIDS